MRQEVLLLVRKMLLMFMRYAVDVLKVVCCGGGDFASVVDRRGDGGTAARLDSNYGVVRLQSSEEHVRSLSWANHVT